MTFKPVPYLFTVLCLLAIQIYSEENYNSKYNGYKLVEVRATDFTQLEDLRRIQREDPEVDFWTEIDEVENPITFMVSPDRYHRIHRELRSSGLQYRVIQDDLQGIISTSTKKKRKLDEFDLDEFNDFDDINRWLNETVSRCPRKFRCEVYSIGTTHEGRDIPVFRLWKEGGNRKAVWIDATIHAREWLSGATALKIIDHIVTGREASARKLREAYDWYIAPVLNPDGYAYSHTEDRLWRKNRSPSDVAECYGTDLNRNFDYHWGSGGISHNPCSQVYCGTHPASELEVEAVQDELLRLGPSLVAMVTLHTYGNMFMFPFGFVSDGTSRCVRSVLHNEMMDVADRSANAIQSVYKTKWKRGTSCEVVYTTSGTSTDYAQAVANISFPFCLELRGDSFLVDAEEINKSFREVWRGVLAMTKEIAVLEYRKNNKNL